MVQWFLVEIFVCHERVLMYHQNGGRRKYVVVEGKIQVVEWYAMLLHKTVRAILKRQCERSILEQEKLHWPAIHSATTWGKDNYKGQDSDGMWRSL